MEENLLWNSSQFGFRKHYNTLMALTHLHENVCESFSSKQFGFGFFLDVCKAFDSVDHPLLIRKLSKYGIVDDSLRWFESYLCGRSQFILSPDGPSPNLNVKTGVPQGSILGPILFNIFINDLPSVLQSLLPSLFADDTNLFLFSRSLPSLVSLSTVDLAAVSSWFTANFLPVLSLPT
eukprot:Pompholyxophrys_punicea_v1_NODE_578_length_1657_cov_4.598627.p1 type:complete len:178 gc:universal NODE_578_length_1657_cov_4.598627:859-326(-)